MNIVEQLRAIGQKAGGDGRAGLSVHIGTRASGEAGDPADKFEIWINYGRGHSATVSSRHSIEDVIRRAWDEVEAESSRSRAERLCRITSSGQHAEGYDNIGY